METLSFAFGMLSIIAVALVAVVVVGMVKVLKMQKKIVDLHNEILHLDDYINRRIGIEVDALNKTVDNLHRLIADNGKELSNRIDDVYRYADSRFDKMENKFIGNSAKKQIIND